MKRTTMFKILLDAAMLCLYLLLMFGQGLGGFFHEAAGLGIGMLFVLHVLLNRSMTKGLMASVRSGRASPGRWGLLLSDLVLTLCMPVVIVTGALIAKELFLVPAELDWAAITTAHTVLSYVCLGAMGLHLLLHGKYLVGVMKKIPAAFGSGEMGAALFRFAGGAALAAVLYGGLFLGQGLSEASGPAVRANGVEQSAPAASSAVSECPASCGAASCPNSTSAPTPQETPQPTPESTATPVEAVSSEDPPAEEQEEPEAPEEPEEPAGPTLEEYLAGLTCTGCRKGCSLLSPSCARGNVQAEQAAQEYAQLYGTPAE